ncbi:MAG: DUF58 domain-containing protein [Planctomycetes bacterium]|nr:DUF58 domain-containing protein [Planctomycetota bacterium]
MIRPTRVFVFLVLASALTAFGPLLYGGVALKVWMATLAALALLFAVDILAAARPGGLTVTAELRPELYVGDEEPLRIRFQAGRGLVRDLELVVETSEEFESPPGRELGNPGADGLEVEVLLRPRRRGSARISFLHWRWCGPLRLAERRLLHDPGLRVGVVPNLRAVREMALTFATRPEFLAGLKSDRILGDGSEFDRLRDFVPGMDTRAIDWKASARHRRLMARQYRAERNHLVVMSIDTGRLMAEPLAGLSRLDHAVNASLLLSWSCLKTGDRVALHAFDERTRKYLEAEGGVRALPRIRQATSDLAYGSRETNYTLGITELSLRLRRRALVVVFTEFADSITAEIMVENLTRLARRHLVLFVTLRDRFLDETTNASPRDLDGVGRAVVTHELARERRLVQERLRRVGVHCLDVLPEELSAQLVQTYLDMKNRELL